MTRTRARGITRFFALSLALPMVFACSGDSTGPDEGGGPGELQFATAVATPKSATIAKGGSVSTTLVYTASPNITFNSFTIQKQHAGISITQTSTQGSGNSITRVYSIGADATVPSGTHLIRFTMSISGATSTVNQTSGEFNLTVN